MKDATRSLIREFEWRFQDLEETSERLGDTREMPQIEYEHILILIKLMKRELDTMESDLKEKEITE